MDGSRARAVLAEEIERLSQLPFDELADLAGAPPSVNSVEAGREGIEIEVCIAWADRRSGAIEITAMAQVSIGDKLERIEESTTVHEPRTGLGDA